MTKHDTNPYMELSIAWSRGFEAGKASAARVELLEEASAARAVMLEARNLLAIAQREFPATDLPARLASLLSAAHDVLGRALDKAKGAANASF
jgi:hypothetical protein